MSLSHSHAVGGGPVLGLTAPEPVPGTCRHGAGAQCYLAADSHRVPSGSGQSRARGPPCSRLLRRHVCLRPWRRSGGLPGVQEAVTVAWGEGPPQWLPGGPPPPGPWLHREPLPTPRSSVWVPAGRDLMWGPPFPRAPPPPDLSGGSVSLAWGTRPPAATARARVPGVGRVGGGRGASVQAPCKRLGRRPGRSGRVPAAAAGDPWRPAVSGREIWKQLRRGRRSLGDAGPAGRCTAP